MANTLQKYYRQPKIYLDLPSQGKFWPPGAIEGDPTKLAVFGMTAMDEIMFKTPDALFSGEATVSVIKSCIPGIINPWAIPSIDMDAILIAMRVATYGQKLETVFVCKSCHEDNKFDLDLTKSLDYFLSLKYETQVIVGPLMVTIRPLTYKEMTEINLRSFELRRRLVNISDLTSEEERNRALNETYKEIGKLNADTYKRSIVSVEVEDEVVNDPQEISDWIKNSDKEFFDKIKEHLESIKESWTLKSQKVNCAHCDAENEVVINLDNSDFFVRK